MGWLLGNGVKKSWLDVRLARLAPNVNDPEIVKKLRSYCLNTSLKDLCSISLSKLEKDWVMPRQKLVSLFLWASKHKIFQLQYVVHCEKCEARGAAKTISDVKHQMTCNSCGNINKPSLDKSIEIVFAIHPDLARAKIAHNHSAFIPAIQVLNTDEFRTLFESEKPLPGEHLRIGDLTFLFTDLFGSTATYEKLGDGGAFRIVREHFTILFDLIKKHNGTVVKTIGDAVMATFLNSSDAIQCALEAKDSFKKFNKRKDIKGAAGLKVGIHKGPCIAVTLNQKLDFFGTTVNKAARVQGIADKDEICVSKEAAESAKHLLEESRVAHKQVTVKGIKKPVEIISVRR